jgi:site-specific DNA recombinase
MDMRSSIYCRVSTDDQRGNYSIPTQVAECLQHVKRRGYSLVGNRYVDPVTGRDCAEQSGAIPAFVDDYSSRELSRPALDDALSFLESMGFDVLVVHALDRLARDPYIRESLEREFERRGARVEFVLGNYEDTAEGEVRKDLDATFAKWENTKRVERSLRGKRGKAERGLFVCGVPPYGYQIDKTAFGGLAIDEQLAALVRRIFELYVNEGKSIRAISGTLTADKVPSCRGGVKWGKSSVAKILRNKAYAGVCFYNQHKRHGKQLALRDKSEWMEIRITPIVEDSLFQAAQARLDENREVLRRTAKRFYLLSSMVFCQDCGRQYVAQTKTAGTERRNEDTYYRHRTKEGHCSNRHLSARRLEDRVWSEVVTLLLNPARLRKGYKQSLAQQDASRTRRQNHLETLRESRSKLEQRQGNLVAAYIDPDIRMPKPEYLKQRTAIEGEIQDVNARIMKTEIELAKTPRPGELESLEKFSAEIRQRLQERKDPTPVQKRELLKMLHVKVFVRLDGETRLEGWFEAEAELGGLLSTSSACCVPRRPRPPARA